MTKVKYNKITETERKKIQDELFYNVVDDFRKEAIEDGFYKYEVQIQDIRFATVMTDEELKDSARLTINLLEELKNINNNGFDKAAFDKVKKDSESSKDDGKVAQLLKIWDSMPTDGLIHIMYEINSVRRVGGAYAMLISNPGLMNAIVAVYDCLADHFDDEDLYAASAYFLYRAVMRVNSDELSVGK